LEAKGGMSLLSRQRESRIVILLLTILVGAIIGTVIGEALGPYMPIFNRSATMGISPTDIHIGRIITFQFGFTLRLNLATAIGLIIALWLLRVF